MRLSLGPATYDLTTRSLVMGILNRTPDSFFDLGNHFAFDAFCRRAEQLVDEGADILDIGGVKAGPGPEVSLEEELDRVVPAVEAARARFDVPLSVDTWRRWGGGGTSPGAGAYFSGLSHPPATYRPGRTGGWTIPATRKAVLG